MHEKDKDKLRRNDIQNSIKKTSWLFIKDLILEGSMTVEASIVLPLFLIFFVNLSCSIEMIRLHSNLSIALWNIGNDFATYGALTTEYMGNLGGTGHDGTRHDETGSNNIGAGIGSYDEWSNCVGYESSNGLMIIESDNHGDNELTVREEDVGTKIFQELGDLVVSYVYVKDRIIDYLGEDYLNNSPLVDGTNSLQFYDSEIFTSDDNIAIVTTYQVAPLIDLGGFTAMRMSNSYYAHLWNGYDVTSESSSDESSRVVFVTENSRVYHTAVSCTYLRLSVRVSSYDNLENERNSDGRRYSRCWYCARSGNPTIIYLCEDGSKYHFSRDCLALRRSFSVVSLSSVVNTHRPCSRCGN